jgi:hypothetical protein
MYGYKIGNDINSAKLLQKNPVVPLRQLVRLRTETYFCQGTVYKVKMGISRYPEDILVDSVVEICGLLYHTHATNTNYLY